MATTTTQSSIDFRWHNRLLQSLNVTRETLADLPTGRVRYMRKGAKRRFTLSIIMMAFAIVLLVITAVFWPDLVWPYAIGLASLFVILAIVLLVSCIPEFTREQREIKASDDTDADWRRRLRVQRDKRINRIYPALDEQDAHIARVLGR